MQTDASPCSLPLEGSLNQRSVLLVPAQGRKSKPKNNSHSIYAFYIHYLCREGAKQPLAGGCQATPKIHFLFGLNVNRYFGTFCWRKTPTYTHLSALGSRAHFQIILQMKLWWRKRVAVAVANEGKQRAYAFGHVLRCADKPLESNNFDEGHNYNETGLECKQPRELNWTELSSVLRCAALLCLALLCLLLPQHFWAVAMIHAGLPPVKKKKINT